MFQENNSQVDSSNNFPQEDNSLKNQVPDRPLSNTESQAQIEVANQLRETPQNFSVETTTPPASQEINMNSNYNILTNDNSTSLPESGNRDEKTVLFIALIFFIFSLVGLSFYLFSGIIQGRFSLDNLFSSKPKSTVSKSEITVSEAPTPTPIALSTYTDGALSFKYPQAMSVSKQSNSWVINNPSLGEDAVVAKIFINTLLDVSAEEYLTNKLMEQNSGLTQEAARGLVSNFAIGNREVYTSYFNDGGEIYVFEDRSKEKLVEIVYYRKNIDQAVGKYLVEDTIISSLSFSDSFSNFSSPSPTPQAE